jgi:metal-responsive CopG/Arc/MetJ family transcriptional regulator
MPINREKTDRIPVTFPKDLTKEVDAYTSLKKDIKTRSKAIRLLVQKGLEVEYQASPLLKEEIQQILDSQEKD